MSDQTLPCPLGCDPDECRHAGLRGALRTALADLTDERDNLARWKVGAKIVIDGWDKVWEAAGRPGRLGEDKTVATLGLIVELRSLLAVASCPSCDGSGLAVTPGHICRNEQECAERCPGPVQIQCEWCARRETACGEQ